MARSVDFTSSSRTDERSRHWNDTRRSSTTSRSTSSTSTKAMDADGRLTGREPDDPDDHAVAVLQPTRDLSRTTAGMTGGNAGYATIS